MIPNSREYMNQVHASMSYSRGDSKTESIAQRGVHISIQWKMVLKHQDVHYNILFLPRNIPL